MMQPALIGGLVMGVLSGLPIISAGNICCCLWVISGGIVAAYVLQQNQPAPITIGDGALAGVLAGVVGSVVYLLLSIPITLIIGPMQRRVLDSLTQSGDIPPEFEWWLSSAVGGAAGIMLGFVAMLMAGLIFCTLGGVIGAAIFRRPPTTDQAMTHGAPPPA